MKNKNLIDERTFEVGVLLFVAISLGVALVITIAQLIEAATLCL